MLQVGRKRDRQVKHKDIPENRIRQDFYSFSVLPERLSVFCLCVREGGQGVSLSIYIYLEKGQESGALGGSLPLLGYQGM